ncbi:MULTISPECIES: 2Fe-2S iron-sulfur cluster-binding protein [Gammaproteobacteria]|jgi:sarcosine oxidase subunit alpha|uniref:(2Fe-2S)-binding protein n=1 Tax=Xanthomonas boreopolis TaxID=86183 RepID=A0A919FAG9_9XANT|nr:2Fe-2S iron-sulfur cluster-binding protein [Pseudomonas sp. Hp2]GHH58549.1 (2Fe-2S)-binding protein [[Pseudomonas] boreopolis]
MSGTLRLEVDGRPVDVPAGASVAAAVAALGVPFRRSREGQPRAPLCGMGVCFECRVRIDGVAQLRACMTPAREGMQVRTDG